MTKNATQFITPLTFETLTGHKCMVDTFDRDFKFEVTHISLARLSCVMGFSSIPVFMAGDTSFGHLAASTTVVSISSAMPFAILAMTLAAALPPIRWPTWPVHCASWGRMWWSS